MKRISFIGMLFIVIVLCTALNADESDKYLKFWEKKHQWESSAANGEKYFKNQDYVNARIAFTEAIKLGAPGGKIYYQRGLCNDKLAGKSEALSDYRTAIDLLNAGKERDKSEYLFYSHYNLGILLAEIGGLEEARSQFEKALAIKPNHARAHASLAMIYAKNGEKQRAIEEYKKACQHDPKLAVARYNLAALYSQTGNEPAAKSEYDKAKLIDPSLPSMEFTKTVEKEIIVEDLGDEELGKAVLNAKTAQDYCNIGVVLYRRNDIEEAAGYFVKALKEDPKHKNSNKMLGQIYMDSEEYAKALKVFKAYLEYYPKDVDALVKTGRLLIKEGSLSSAKTYLEKALSLNKNDLRAHFYLAVCGEYNKSKIHYGEGFDIREVETHYNECLRINPNSVETLYNLGMLYAHIGKMNEANKIFNRIIALYPDSPGVYYNIGCIYDELGLKKEAIISFQRAVDLDPDFTDAWFNMGAVLVAYHDYRAAARVYRRVLDIDPEYADAMINLAILYDKHLNNKRRANYFYHQYVYAKPTSTPEDRKMIKKRIIKINPA